MKRCSLCSGLKPLDQFHKQTRVRSGLQPQCKVCTTALAASYYRNNKDRILKRNAAWKKAHPTVVRNMGAAQYQRTKERHRAQMKAWSENNRDLVRAFAMKHYAQRMRAVPRWADHDKIKLVYQKANEWGMQVDHVVPLQSDTVCGLHVWENLQLLAPSINASKQNRYWPDMP